MKEHEPRLLDLITDRYARAPLRPLRSFDGHDDSVETGACLDPETAARNILAHRARARAALSASGTFVEAPNQVGDRKYEIQIADPSYMPPRPSKTGAQ